MVVIYWLLTAWVINEFKIAFLKFASANQYSDREWNRSQLISARFLAPSNLLKVDDHIIEVFVPLREQYGLFNFPDDPCFCSFLMYQL